MLTYEEINKEAEKSYKTSSYRGAFIEGATWANKKNAAEIEKLKRTADMVVRLRAENEELEALYAMAKNGTRMQNDTIRMLCDIVEKLKPGTIPEKIYENLEKMKER